MRIFFLPSLSFYIPCTSWFPLFPTTPKAIPFYLCSTLAVFQHFGFIRRHLIVITQGLTLYYIKTSLHLVYNAPLHCWNNISGSHCKWKSSLCFCNFLQSAVFVPIHKIKQNSHDKKRDPSVFSLSKECPENWCYQSFIIAHKTDLRAIYWIQQSIKKLN